MKLKLGFSPCPNDTFIFDAMIHHKIDTEGLEFEVFYDDVETLNQKSFSQDLDITKLSFHAYAYCVSNYVLLDSGSALGYGVGPLVISKLPYDGSGNIGKNTTVAIPGKFTTASFLFGLAFPQVKNKIEMVFSAIEDAVLNDEVDLGLIIHENRFTYQQKGLHKVIDLGAFWEEKTGCPIPLGGIVIKRSLNADIKNRVNRVIRRSVEYAFENPQSGIDFIRSHAQAMDDEVMYKHIELYVNKYSVDLGQEGRNAIELMFAKAVGAGVIPHVKEHLFLS
ncbi:1,4-dihydroxy-6-naphthoate synthase [Arcticibacter pallidicorallinus]|uniref:1,4-dihydroxy-6-naphtoate synthase n=1 Tax=Arcticibacter pallidicorallinus TaxID=1259464 RepID=A0A2T0U7J9_9SPHI|nr:1,4-dihydroxy-6-naphthoate synthase [Arcticibacter pallidicorallinus]PRY53896.1 1,4-dihydroxy-6-naphthoate synthase [Arcticibacter pallidicorallinus]